MPPENVRTTAADTMTSRVKLSCAGADVSNALDFAHFADTMASLASTVCVATAADGDMRLGRTITAVTSLTAQPPSILISITKGSDLARLIERTGRFSLSLLADDQNEIGNAFAGKLNVDDRFALGSWSSWPSGQPKLAGAATSIECKLAGIVEMDTHSLFIGILIGAETTTATPLLWYERGYHTLTPKP